MRWDRSSTENFYYGMKVMGVVLSFMMFMVWEHVEARHLERRLTAMRKEEDQLIYQNARLQSQINQWLSPSHLETLARKQLGMAPPDPGHRIGVELP
jgi:cell division protein FtsL